MRRLLVAFLLVLCAQYAAAHEMTIAEMELRETSHGDFLWEWSAFSDKRPAEGDLRPRWPQGCAADATALHCGANGLRGVLSIDGIGTRYSAALVKIFWLGGESRVYTLTAAQPRVQLYGSAEDPRGWWEIARAYVVLGVEHILTGYDHLLFVLGLLFLVGFGSRLLWTVTAFTAAHSVTLACAALGWLTLRPPPVEACIALSIVLVAGEALHARMTLARRWPALLAFLFGLVHGLGFAGALREVGLPVHHVPAALLAFNGGVEIGQLFAIAVAWGLFLALRGVPSVLRLRTPALYGIGSIAAYWSWLRAAAMIAG